MTTHTLFLNGQNGAIKIELPKSLRPLTSDFSKDSQELFDPEQIEFLHKIQVYYSNKVMESLTEYEELKTRLTLGHKTLSEEKQKEIQDLMHNLRKKEIRYRVIANALLM